MANIFYKTVTLFKKLADIAGGTPVFGASDGINVGDRVIDTSTNPNRVWVCKDNTNGASVYIKEDDSADYLKVV